MPVPATEIDQEAAAVLRELEVAGEMRRSELAESVDDVTKSRFPPALETLVEHGLVERSKEPTGRVGAPAVVLRLTARAGHPVVVDIGHETNRVAVGSPTRDALIAADGDDPGRPWAEWRRETGPDKTIFAEIAEKLEVRLGKLGKDLATDVRGICVSMAAPIGVDGRIPRFPLAWADTNIGEEVAGAIQRRSGVDVSVIAANDANLAALGEAEYGIGRPSDGNGSAGGPCEDFLFIKVSAGLGVGYIRRGSLERGPGFLAGEFGHTPLPDPELVEHEIEEIGGFPDGIEPLREPLEEALRCPWCGSLGCLETVGSATGMMRRLRARGFPAEKRANDAIALATRSGAYSQLCRWALEETGTYLGLSIAGLVNSVDAERVVIGGVISQANELLTRPIQRQIDKRCAHRIPPEVTVSAVQPGSGVMGGMVLVMREVPVLEDGIPRRHGVVASH